MVVFEEGLPKKSDYRKFRIRGLGPQPDDYAAMHEVVGRRYRGLLEAGKELPDLVLIDGGKGQLGAAMSALEELGLGDQPVASLAKREEVIFVPGREEPLVLPRSSPVLQLVQRVRDEAHRFAIGFHRQTRDKRTLRSELDDIPGVGPIKRRKLLSRFGSLRGVRGASVQDLATSVGSATAARIRAWLDRALDRRPSASPDALFNPSRDGLSDARSCPPGSARRTVGLVLVVCAASQRDVLDRRLAARDVRAQVMELEEAASLATMAPRGRRTNTGRRPAARPRASPPPARPGTSSSCDGSHAAGRWRRTSSVSGAPISAVERAIEDLRRVAGGNGMAQQILRVPQLRDHRRAGGELDEVAVRRQRVDGEGSLRIAVATSGRGTASREQLADLALGLERRGGQQLPMVLGQVRDEQAQRRQVQPAVGEHVQDHRELPRRAGGGDAVAGAVLGQVEDRPAVLV